MELKGVEPKDERVARRLTEARERGAQKRLQMQHEDQEHTLKTGEGYNWGFGDLLQAPFATGLGALNALGQVSSASYCSRYTLSARQYVYDAEPFFAEDNALDGYDYYHQAGQYADNIAYACFNAFSSEISVSHIKSLTDQWYNVPINLLYNFGFMWVDVINYIFYNYENVPQGDWGFFFFYTWGDFFMRFLFNASDGDESVT
jgi:hypothetical protein